MQSMFKRTPILQQLEDNETDIYFTAIDSSLDYSVSKFEKETSSAPKKYPLSCTELEFDLKSDDEQKEGSVASSDRFDELEKNVSIRITHHKTIIPIILVLSGFICIAFIVGWYPVSILEYGKKIIL